MNASADHVRPPLLQDRSFWGLNLTQFFGAFNDNLFKQLVMLDCLDQARQGGKDLQGLGLILFAVPFILISGYAGFLSDRFRKRTIIVACKVAEVLIILLGMMGFWLHSLPFLLMVLCLMGVHSAFFGPSKYGILPEMLRNEDLPRANGLILMATFLAIIFGLTAAGAAKHFFAATLWLASIPCLFIAMAGLAASLTIRQTPIAQPNLKFDVQSLLIAPETRKLLRGNHQLFWVLLMSSVFWFVGGTIYPPAINALAKEQFHFNDMIAGILAASTGVGIAVGCVIAGVLSKNRVRGGIVRLGAWGLTLSLLALALPGPGWNEVREEIRTLRLGSPATIHEQSQGKSEDRPREDRTLGELTTVEQVGSREATPQTPRNPAEIQRDYFRGTMLGPWGSALALISVGLFAGFYSVPLQVYLQSKAPSEQKGRIIGANNLVNWIGIASAGGVCFLGRIVLVDWLLLPYASLFGLAAALMLPVALFYRPPNVRIESTPE